MVNTTSNVLTVVLGSFERFIVCVSDNTRVTLLTVLHLCDDGIRVKRFTNSKLVYSRDPELVLITLNKIGGIIRASFTFR